MHNARRISFDELYQIWIWYESNKHFTRLAQVCGEADVRSNIRLRDTIHGEWFESWVMVIECHCVVSTSLWCVAQHLLHHFVHLSGGRELGQLWWTLAVIPLISALSGKLLSLLTMERCLPQRTNIGDCVKTRLKTEVLVPKATKVLPRITTEVSRAH